MKIVIPMSGLGERFKKAGYSLPKALIPMEGKPMLQHVVEMFPGENEFIFICNEVHLKAREYRMQETLKSLGVCGEILAIPQHKLGPVFAISQVFDRIHDDEQVIVNYCDFTCYWDFADFCSFVEETQSDACLPCYRGFHPHMLGTTNYAFLREQGLWATDIQEKKPFTNDRMREFASSGTFYFATGKLLKHYFQQCMTKDLMVNGEFYVSMAMKPMMDDGLRVSIYELEHFMQWGTPEDVVEYNEWSSIFKSLRTSSRSEKRMPGSLLVPMAGLGRRFSDAGYGIPKPLISVSGAPMVIQASLDLPKTDGQVFVLRKDLDGLKKIVMTLASTFPQSTHVILPEVTDGQARTCLAGVIGIGPNAPLTIGACDNGVLYDSEKYHALYNDPSVDVIVWSKSGYPGAAKNPQGYGWLEVDGDNVKRASVKVPLSDPITDPIIIGTFTFKRTSDFVRAADSLIERNGLVNGELYVDSLINDSIRLGLNVKAFEVEHYVCWGTPDDLRTFEYWQSCFHKWHSHPYRIETDSRIPINQKEPLVARCEAFRVPRPQVLVASLCSNWRIS
jgi:dTDP-glucose pyrophosphorylase